MGGINMGNVELITSFKSYVDEMFTTESKRSLITNQDIMLCVKMLELLLQVH